MARTYKDISQGAMERKANGDEEKLKHSRRVHRMRNSAELVKRINKIEHQSHNERLCDVCSDNRTYSVRREMDKADRQLDEETKERECE